MHGPRPREWRPAKLVWLFRRMRIGNLRNHFQAMARYGIRVMADVSSRASLKRLIIASTEGNQNVPDSTAKIGLNIYTPIRAEVARG